MLDKYLLGGDLSGSGFTLSWQVRHCLQKCYISSPQAAGVRYSLFSQDTSLLTFTSCLFQTVCPVGQLGIRVDSLETEKHIHILFPFAKS